jgi:hypothetical protein
MNRHGTSQTRLLGEKDNFRIHSLTGRDYQRWRDFLYGCPLECFVRPTAIAALSQASPP